MTVWSIGFMAHRKGVADELARVTADASNARITGVQVAGDTLGFLTVLDARSDALCAGKTPTPMSLAVAVAGDDGTVHEVLADGRLRGWRRDYPGVHVSDSDRLSQS